MPSTRSERGAYFERDPSAVQKLWDDSIEALIQVTHAGANEPELDAKDGVSDKTADYRAIHKPWTRVLGIRSRQLEPPNPGTYGGIVRRWLPYPR